MEQEQPMAPTLAAGPEEERQEAMARLAGLRPHLHDGVPWSEAACDTGVPLRSAQRWRAWEEPHERRQAIASALRHSCR